MRSGTLPRRAERRILARYPPNPGTLSSESTSARALLLDLYDAAITGASPGPVTSLALRDLPARAEQRIWIYALGKAAVPMAAAAVATLQRSLLRIAGGVIVSEEAQPAPHPSLVSLRGDHPLPGRNSFTAAAKIGDIAAGKRGDDVSLVLISGGASSLIASPLRGMAESDLGQLFELLLGSGLDIQTVNAIRKRFTRWGAGRLALALAPSRTHVLIMSDVLGDNAADIGSGPCTPDPTTVKDIVALLQKSGLLARVAPPMREYLNSVSRGVIPETPKATHPAFAHVSTRIVGSNKQALSAIQERATDQGLAIELVATPISGDAAACGAMIANALLERAAKGVKGVVVWGGETTVQLSRNSGGAVTASEQPPSGGRCQELALAAARRLAQAGDAGLAVTLLAAGTDGRDGTTDAAGGFADASVVAMITAAGRDTELALQRHEAHQALHAADALIPRRNTGTNVMDVVIGLIQ